MTMKGALQRFAQTRPCLWQALLWSIPALLAGFVFRTIIFYHNPYAYWSQDSASYLEFARELLEKGKFDLDPKRRWVYPIFLLLPHALPGSTLKWVSALQHLIVLLSVIPLSYTIRKVCIGWKVFLIPLSLIYVFHPHFTYYSDQVLGESIFLATVVWSIGGWTAWISTPAATRFRVSRFLLFYVPFAMLILTKPSGRFYWPGLLVAGLLALAWKRMTRWHWALLGVLLVLTPTVGKQSQGIRLIYSSAFPLTQLQTDKHADYKAEIAPMVRRARQNIHRYYACDKEFKRFLENPERRPDLKLWVAFAEKENEKKRDKVFRDLAMEGVLHEPHMMVYIAFQRIIGSHLRGLKEERLTGNFYAERMAEDYLYPELTERFPATFRRLYGLPRNKPIPSLIEMQQRVIPHPESAYDRWIAEYLVQFERASRLVGPEDKVKQQGPIYIYRPTVLGMIALIGLVVGFLGPYRGTIGAWTLFTLSYLFGVYSVGSANGRFFIPALPWILLLLAIPFDGLLRMIQSIRKPRAAPPSPASEG